MGLPYVSEEVAAAVRAEIGASRDSEYLLSLVERLEHENPHLLTFISAYALQFEDRASVASAAMLTYRLLESQDEADRMRREFGSDRGA